MPISADMFRRGMRRLGGAVNIVTTGIDDEWAGLTATAVTSLSAEPPRILACINRQGVSYELLSKGRTLAVNVLDASHKSLAERFAGLDQTPEQDRFGVGEWSTLKTGAPVLNDALVSFDCTVESILDAGSHAIVIGNIEAIKIGETVDFSPLCYLDGNWATLAPLTNS